MDLLKTFNALLLPKENDEYQFSAIPIAGYDNHRIAKDKEGNPILLISISKQQKIFTVNLKLQNVSVLFDVKCSIRQNEDVVEKKFTTISFIGRDVSLRKYFLKLCSSLIENIGNTPTQESVSKEIIHFVELFRLLNEPQTKTTQGLWAELF